MAKIVLGKRPESFKKTVKVKLLDGSEGSIECDYKYRSRKEFGEFVDRLAADSETAIAVGEDGEPKFSLADMLAKVSDKNADYIMEVLLGWNLDVEFSPEAVRQLCDELPGVSAEIIETYRAACVEGRLKN